MRHNIAEVLYRFDGGWLWVTIFICFPYKYD